MCCSAEKDIAVPDPDEEEDEEAIIEQRRRARKAFVQVKMLQFSSHLHFLKKMPPGLSTFYFCQFVLLFNRLIMPVACIKYFGRLPFTEV
jgi:hypothetical protein